MERRGTIITTNIILPHLHRRSSNEDPSASQSTSPHHHRHHHPHISAEQISTVVVNFFSHMFAPTSYLQCTSSGRWSEPLHEGERNHTIVVDDEFILIDDDKDPDGGPICREAAIASWKSGKADRDGQAMGMKRRRRSSVQWLTGMVRRESAVKQ
ncbi:hypothetical protein NX059_009523 [Plenodomus lindquistii]|nr:hypothetical protein NX059_009523 [Plenodomus lindquistii]